MLALVAAAVPSAKAAGLKVTFSPAEAAVGATVQITGSGFSPVEPVTFVCNNNQMFAPSVTADSAGNIVSSCTVPDFPAGTYHVTVYDSSGLSVSAPFIVTGGGSSTASPIAPSSSSSSSGNGNGNGNSNGNGNGNGTGTAMVIPTYSPTPTSSSSGFWSPTVIGVIVAVLIAFAISGVLLYSRQGKQRMMLERERERDRERSSLYGPELTSGAIRARRRIQSAIFKLRSSAIWPRWLLTVHPYSYRSPSSSGSYQSRYNQTSSYRPSPYASRYSQPSSYRQPAATVKLQSTTNRIRKLALTAKDPSEKTKTFAHTAIKGYKQSAVKCQASFQIGRV